MTIAVTLLVTVLATVVITLVASATVKAWRRHDDLASGKVKRSDPMVECGDGVRRCLSALVVEASPMTLRTP